MKMEKKDVLECCRSWNKPLNDVDDFLQSRLTHKDAQVGRRLQLLGYRNRDRTGVPIMG